MGPTALDRRALRMIPSLRRWLTALGAAGVTLQASCAPLDCPDLPPRLSLIDHDKWRSVPPEEDVFAPAEGDEIYPCDERDIVVEDLGEIRTWSVTTGACNWATVSQPLPRALEAGEELLLEVFWFSQRDFPGGTARIGLALDDEIVFTKELQVPAEAELLETFVGVPRDMPRGTPVRFHIGNHGTNSWNLIDISVPNDAERPAHCPAPEDDRR